MAESLIQSEGVLSFLLVRLCDLILFAQVEDQIDIVF